MNDKIMFWTLEQNGHGVCSKCHRQDTIDPLAKYCRYCGAKIVDYNFCDNYYSGLCLATKEMDRCMYYNDINKCPIHQKDLEGI